MKPDYSNLMCRANCLASDLDSLYHQAALKLGLSDSVMFVMYLVYEKNGKCPLNDIRIRTGISKQTLNSAIRKLESEGIIYLQQPGKRGKTVCLTREGTEYANRTVGKLFNAECSAFNGWKEEEVNLYLNLMEKYNKDFREQIEKIDIND